MPDAPEPDDEYEELLLARLAAIDRRPDAEVRADAWHLSVPDTDPF